MVKVEQNKNSRIVLHVVIAIVIVLILAVFFGVVVISLNGGRSSRSIKPIENESESEEKKTEKADNKKKDKDKKEDGSDDKTDLGDVRPIKGEITSAGLSGNNISVRVRIDEALDNAACKLTLTSPQQQTYSQTVNTVASGDSAALCNGFDVSLNSMGLSNSAKERKGEWQVVVDVTYGSRASQFATKFTL